MVLFRAVGGGAAIGRSVRTFRDKRSGPSCQRAARSTRRLFAGSAVVGACNTRDRHPGIYRRSDFAKRESQLAQRADSGDGRRNLWGGVSGPKPILVRKSAGFWIPPIWRGRQEYVGFRYAISHRTIDLPVFTGQVHAGVCAGGGAGSARNFYTGKT